MSSAASKAWIVAASIFAVEALKDQGICRWNYTIRSLQQHAKSNIRSFTQSKILASSSSSRSSSPTTAAAVLSNEIRKANMKRREKSLEKSCQISNVIADQLIQENPRWNELFDLLDPKL
ncbi:unnamed protein product [Dovyalis caffra]|uniref:Wound-responsive family protein n=1 Tax=Dovyalis caffra TaxID=77055 RepID=A0AAV1R2I8_9ROSI|nr:unnamed protein product [Dovyalis caffra]